MRCGSTLSAQVTRRWPHGCRLGRDRGDDIAHAAHRRRQQGAAADDVGLVLARCLEELFLARVGTKIHDLEVGALVDAAVHELVEIGVECGARRTARQAARGGVHVNLVLRAGKLQWVDTGDFDLGCVHEGEVETHGRADLAGETEGQMLCLRWAKAMKHVAENITVYIDEDNLICGRGGVKGRYGLLYPELDGDFLDVAVQDLPSRTESPFSISEEDAKIVVEEIAPYWKGKTYHEALNAALPPEIHKLSYDDPEGLASRFIVNETSSFRSSIQWVHDYEKILKRGFGGIKQEEVIPGVKFSGTLSALFADDTTVLTY